MQGIPSRRSSILNKRVPSLAAALVLLGACKDRPDDGDEVRRVVIESHRQRLAQPITAEERAALERQLERLERGETALDEQESLRLMGYTVTTAREAERVYRNATHGYQVTVPAGVELQEHRNGHYVMVPSHGTLFGIWVHPDEPQEQVEAKLLGEFERWCAEHPESARERAENGGSLRLVGVSQGPFAGYKAIPEDLPDTAPARFYAFRSPKQDGWFGFNLTPELAGALFASLQPLAPPAPEAR